MTTQELIQIETASMATNNGLDYMFQVVINQQDTPAISLDGLRELRRLCDCFIHLGEENEQTRNTKQAITQTT